MDISRRQFIRLAALAAAVAFIDYSGATARTAGLFPMRYQNAIKAGDMSADPSILEAAYQMFDPALQPYLRSVPIIETPLAQTAFEHTGAPLYSRRDYTYIAVSPDFNNLAGQSKFWTDYYSRPPYNYGPTDPVFSESFKLELLVHELIHVAGDYLKKDYARFYLLVRSWYQNRVYGRPAPYGISYAAAAGSNREKYVLWWNLYAMPGDPASPLDETWKAMTYCDRYRNSLQGLEEYAYLAQGLLVPGGVSVRTDRLRELMPEIIDSYEGVIHPDILALRTE